MLTNKAKYALRALVVLARDPDRALRAREVATRARVPEKFLEAILVTLRQAGFVESRRGLLGGHALALAPEAIRVGDIIRAIDGPLAPLRCASVTAYQPCADCPDPDRCALRGLMADVRDAISRVLDHQSLQQLAHRAQVLEAELAD